MKCFVAGATGLIGGHLIQQLLQDDLCEKIHIIGRNLSRINDHPKIKKHESAFESLNSFDEEVDTAFCCLGTTIKKAKTKEQFAKIDKDYPLYMAKRFNEIAPEGRFLIVTATGADSRSKVYYNKVKGEVEDALREMKFKHLVLAQPSLLIGERSEKRLMEGLGQTLLKGIPLPKSIKPIEGEQVAKALISMAKDSKLASPFTASNAYLHSL